jgi:transcriptional regulator with XRE-family HTH domain
MGVVLEFPQRDRPPKDPRPRRTRLREFREAGGLSREELAAKVAAVLGKASLHERTIYRWEIGETRIPEEAMAWFGDYFHVSIGHLLRWDARDAGLGLGA